MAPASSEGVSSRNGVFSAHEVAQHNRTEDCWLVVDDSVYDATNFLSSHPGGKVLASYAGADATDVFGAFHPESAQKFLKPLYIGELAKGETVLPNPGLIDDYRKLKAEFEAEGLFEASPAYYVFKVVFNTCLLFAAVAIVVGLPRPLAALFGSLTLAVFWQQCGWLSHDFLHHQVFENRTYNRYMGFLLGNFYQGFSVMWWQSKHNTHHAVPNMLEGVRDGDPDIQTLPILAWADEILEHGFTPGTPTFILKNQKVLYLPILGIARISWVIQSIIHVFTSADSWTWRRTEMAALAGHYLYFFSLVWYLGPTWGAVFFFLAEAFGGLLLGSVFAINHNAMPVLPPDSVTSTNFAEMQILTTRDISHSFLVSWFTGGLNYQLEHHLFPSLPRHNFHLIQKRIQKLCEDHKLPYEVAGFWEGNGKLFQRLGEVAANVDGAVAK